MPNPEEENSTPLPIREEPTRRPILDYFQKVANSDRFWRIFSSREKMIEGMKTFFWVAPLTLLIWIYAVREQVIQPNSPNAFHIVVNLKSTDPNLYVEFDGEGPLYQRTVDLQLTGPQSNLEQVKESLIAITAGQPQGVTIDLRSDLPVGDHQPVNVVDRIQNSDVFKYNGVTVQQSVPDTFFVNVDKKAELHEVPVLVKPGVANLAPESRFDPPTVTVSGPAKLLKTLKESGQLKVYAKLDGYEQQFKEPGPKTIPSVPLEFSPFPQDKLVMSANQVTANLVLTASDVPYVITDAIILEKVIPATLNADVNLDTSDMSIANIAVRGPQQAIDAIMAKPSTVEVQLKILAADSGTVTRALTYVLPPGVTVSAKDLARTITFTVAPR